LSGASCHATSTPTTSSSGKCCDAKPKATSRGRRSRRDARGPVAVVTVALLVHDDGPGAGLGHRRRCEALAAALEARGIGTAVVPVDDERLDAPVIVVDSYERRADDRAWATGRLVVALDDLARDLAVACVIDPAVGATSARHRRAGRVLAGPRYV